MMTTYITITHFASPYPHFHPVVISKHFKFDPEILEAEHFKHTTHQRFDPNKPINTVLVDEKPKPKLPHIVDTITLHAEIFRASDSQPSQIK